LAALAVSADVAKRKRTSGNSLTDQQRPYAVTVEYLAGLSPVRGIVRFAPVVQGSGVLVTEGRKFPIGKATGRNASEPGCSLVRPHARFDEGE